MKTQRINAFLAGCLGRSRRSCDELIAGGRVTVDGRPAHPGTRVGSGADVRLDGRVLETRALGYLALNKPKGVLTARRVPGGVDRRRMVSNLLPAKLRHLVPVGRLDKDTRGLLIVTNDGALAERILHPRYEVLRLYRVGLDRVADLARIREGVLLEDGWSRFNQVRRIAEKELRYTETDGDEIEVVMAEGRKRQIRRTLETIGYRVVDLVRIEMAGIKLGDLAEGKYRELTAREIGRLKADYGARAK